MDLKFLRLLIVFTTLLLVCSCTGNTKKEQTSLEEEPASQSNLPFNKVDGVRFYEVKRRFKNGLSFNEIGFQQEPTWIIEFKAPDTMLAYSPEKRGMEAFYLQYDHGKVYNFAREFFRLKAITKDSLVLQRLQVDGKVIAGDDDERSNVYCTFYTKNYIEEVLKTTIGELQRPSPADTAYIQQLSARTYKDPANPTMAFAARTPVLFIPKGKFVTVEKISRADAYNQSTLSYDYIYPEYRIAILKSYKAFAYRFSVVVDHNGKMYVNRVEGVMADDIPSRKKLVQGITDVYLQNLLKIIPGTTLGIPHSSEVTLNVVGKLSGE